LLQRNAVAQQGNTMTFSDAEIKILAETLSKHTGQQFDLAAPDARTTIGSAYVAIEDQRLLAKLQAELKASGVRIEDEAEELPPAEFGTLPISDAVSEAMADDAPSRGVSTSLQEKLRQIRSRGETVELSNRETEPDLLSAELKLVFRKQLGAALDELRDAREATGLWYRFADAVRAFRGSTPAVYTFSLDVEPQPTLKIFSSKYKRNFSVFISHSARDVSRELTEATGSPSEARAVVESVLEQIGNSRGTAIRAAGRSMVH
jgi:hypothetical protein